MENKHIYVAINNVQAALAKSGISKGRKNQQQGYAFRGIDDVYLAVAPLFAEQGIVVLPHYTERTCVERTTTKGGLLFYVTLKGTFDLVDASDGSSVSCDLYGEAMDSADKATNKAMSAAYKYMCIQTFCIPTEGDNDADATTHSVAPQKFIPDDEIPEFPRSNPDDWMTENAFAGACERATTPAELQALVNSQRGNPNIKTLLPYASARKAELTEDK